MANFYYILSGMSPDWTLTQGLYVCFWLVVVPLIVYAVLCFVWAVCKAVASFFIGIGRELERRRKNKSRNNYWGCR